MKLLLAALLSLASPAAAERAADYVIVNARVFSGSTTSLADTVAIAGNRILAVGPEEELAARRDAHTKVLDASGRWLLPGFDDARADLMAGGLSLFSADGSTAPAAGAAGPSPEHRREALARALVLARSLGVTTIQQPLDQDARDVLTAWRGVAAAGTVTARCVFWGRLEDPQGFLRLKSEFKDLPKDRFLFAGLEGAVDGDIADHAAALSKTYADEPELRGVPAFTQGDLNRLVLRANNLGLRVRLRATGDGAARMALDAFALARRSVTGARVRNSVERLTLLDSRDLPRFKSVGVVAVGELRHEPGDLLAQLLGPARASRLFGWRALEQAGASLAFASDWPNGALDPRAGLASAENIARADAVLHYTKGGSLAFARENAEGSVAAGMPADLVLMGAGLFDAQGPELLKVPVDAVFFDGKPVFASDDKALRDALGPF